MVEGLQRLCTNEETVEGIGGTAELLYLMLLTHEGLHHADGRHILLDGAVQVVVAHEHLGEELHRARDDEVQSTSEHHQGREEDKAHAEVDEHAHQHGEHQIERSAHRGSQYHDERPLHVLHISGHARYEPTRREAVDIGKREGLDVAVHRLAQIVGKACRGLGRISSGQHTERQAQEGHHEHQPAIEEHVVDVAHHDAAVDNPRCDVGYQYAHHHFERGDHRCEQCSPAEAFQLSKDSFQNRRSLFQNNDANLRKQTQSPPIL